MALTQEGLNELDNLFGITKEIEDEKQREKMQDLIRQEIEFIGDKPEREGLIDTPKRVVKSWSELYCGYKQSPEEILSTTFTDCNNYDQMILLKDIDFYSTCEHHILPFFGKACVAYIPDKKVVGISKLARLVDCFARRLQIQEVMTSEICNTITKVLRPKGVAVLVEAQHFCMVSRGVKKPNAKMVTSAMSGCFKTDPSTRNEFLMAVYAGK